MFVKEFKHPIEKVYVLATGTSELSYVNADRAHNYGAELEVRKGLGVLTPALTPFTLFANTTLMKSDITPGNEGISRAYEPQPADGGPVGVRGERRARLVQRRLGRNGALQRGRQADRRGGQRRIPDTYEQARNLVDASLQVPVLQRMSMRLDGKNLLDSPYRLTQGDVVRHEYHSGRLFSLGVTWRP